MREIRDSIASLKKLLVESTDFAAVWSWFAEHLAEHPALLRASQPVESAVVQGAVETLLVQHYGSRARLDQLLLLEVRDLDLVHGLWSGMGRTGAVFYCAEVGKGMLLVPRLLGTHETSLFRFTVSPVPDGSGTPLRGDARVH